jgi:hypothetical protein
MWRCAYLLRLLRLGDIFALIRGRLLREQGVVGIIENNM